ncbi:MAG: choice-of-anchor J domain-containing protein [Bacteroidales bacterium]|nr:choice-of-anchor J domain-containing protein [Bacteroidales bacterium]
MKKVVRFFAMAALCGGLCFGFAACGGDEDEGEEGPEVLLEEAFNADIPTTWTNIDADGDGFVWMMHQEGCNGTTAACSYSWDPSSQAALTPDNYLVSPEFKVPSKGYKLTWQVAAQDPAYPADHYEVLVGTLSGNTFSGDKVYSETLSTDQWNLRTVDLDQYKGQTVRIAFRHCDCSDLFIMKIDDVKVAK